MPRLRPPPRHGRPDRRGHPAILRARGHPPAHGGGAFSIQVAFGALVLFVPAGRRSLEFISVQVQHVINSANAGIDFLFGSLADPGSGIGFVFAIKVLPIILNEFVAYADFVQVKDSLSGPTQGILTFALCGFANLSSIAILLGGLGGMAPTRRAEIARLGLKAVAAASMANFMSAAIAGFFIHLG